MCLGAGGPRQHSMGPRFELQSGEYRKNKKRVQFELPISELELVLPAKTSL